MYQEKSEEEGQMAVVPESVNEKDSWVLPMDLMWANQETES